jgi:orotidine-5'-phosphate decarboxylase
MNHGFYQKSLEVARSNNSLVCVGLDSDIERIPRFLIDKFKDQAVLEFNKQIIDATKDLVCAYKLNIAFYVGPKGLEILKATRDYIKDIPVICDAKCADIGSSSRAYAKALFDVYGFDAVVVNPYLGYDSLKPFFEYKDKGVFVLCRTSNPGAREFQDLPCNGKPLYQVVAHRIKEWNEGNLGVVAGATYPKELGIIRKIVGEDVPMLIPGIGAQGGSLKEAVEWGTNSKGELAIINSSRGIIFASSGEDFALKTRKAALNLRRRINRYRCKKI